MSSSQKDPEPLSAQHDQPTRDEGGHKLAAASASRGKGRERGKGRGAAAPRSTAAGVTTHHVPAKLVQALTFKVATVPNHVPHPPVLHAPVKIHQHVPPPWLPPPHHAQPQQQQGAYRRAPGPWLGSPPQLPPLPPPPTAAVSSPGAHTFPLNPTAQQIDLPPHTPSQPPHSADAVATSAPPALPPPQAQSTPPTVQISTRQSGQTSRPSVVRPTPSSPTNPNTRTYTFSQRVQVLTLLTHQYSPSYIEFVTGVRAKAQLRMLKTAETRGFDFLKDPRVLDRHVVDGMRSGRPKGSRDKGRRRPRGYRASQVEREAKDGEDEEKVGGEEDGGVGDQEMDVEDGEDVYIDIEADAGLEEQLQQEEETRNNNADGDGALHAKQLQGVTSTLAGITEFLSQVQEAAKT